ncbi:MAG: hypothetical protein MUE30_16880 [Spirosomaceae bacterium]|nr:hypothetical protein [Spirosomataceae bacterium]
MQDTIQTLPHPYPAMNGATLAQVITAQYGTTDPEALAQRAGVQVHYARWFPATYGEFCAKTRTITLNQNAPVSLGAVLAHELGHYFAQEAGYEGNTDVQEEIAKSFAEVLLQSL